MSPMSSALRGRLRRLTAVCVVLFAATAGGLPAASAHAGTTAKTTAKTTASAKSAKAASSSAKVRPNDALPDQPNLDGAYVPVTPVRVLDTRNGTGTHGAVAKVGQNALMLDVSGITGNASVKPTAVVLNVTVVAPTKNTFVEAYPNGNGPSGTSNLNVPAGNIVANQITVQVGQNGMVDFYNAVGQTDLVADLAGYFTLDKAAANYVPDGPVRILDTRNGTGGISTAVGPGQSAKLKVTNVDGVPSGATAVVLNVTATASTKNSYLTVYPDGAAVPSASSLNFAAGQTVPNLVTVAVGADGEVDFFNDAGNTQVIADLAGYYVAGSPQAGGVLDSSGPTRMLDTRSGTGGATGPVGPGKSIKLQVTGVDNIPTGATAVVLNVTATQGTKNSLLTVYPDGESTPSSSNLNFAAGQTIANLVVVPIGADGKVDFFNAQGDTQVIADVFGYFAAGSKLGISAFSFANSTVDASAGGATDTLTFTITDSDTAATQTSGELEFRQVGSGTDTYVGEPFYIGFNPQVTNASYWATFVSGTAASSTYSYAFYVPQYSGAASAKWAVSFVTIDDSPGNQQSVYAGSALSGFGNSITATESVSTIVPTYDGVSAQVSPAYLYDGVDTSAEYSIEVQDSQSGFSNGSITVSGPDGQSATGEFAQYFDGEQQESFPCTDNGNTITGTDDHCQVPVYLPAGAAAGTWSITSITLTNNAGQSKTYSGLDLAPLTVTSDSVVKASAFKDSPTQVNNWASNATFTLSMDVSGAQGGVSSIQLYTLDGVSTCSQQSTTPTIDSDGSLSVKVTMDELIQFRSSCTIDGIAITDGQGDVALYGADFTPTALGLTVTNTPDTTPPVATSAKLNITSVPQSQALSTQVYITVQTKSLLAPIDGSASNLYNSSGTVVGEEGGGASVDANGQLMISVYLPAGLAVGTYTVGFSLTDKGGLTTTYGEPGSAAVPGGALTLTVTSG